MYHGDDNNLDDNDEITKIIVRPPVINFNQTICGVINQSEASDEFVNLLSTTISLRIDLFYLNAIVVSICCFVSFHTQMYLVHPT